MTTNSGILTATELKQRLDHGEDMVLIDVLPEEMFAGGHIPGSENVPSDRPEFEREVLQIAGNKHRHIVVYCGGGNRSSSAAITLTQSGFSNVDHFKGGMIEWNRHGYPVENGIHTESRR